MAAKAAGMADADCARGFCYRMVKDGLLGKKPGRGGKFYVVPEAKALPKEGLAHLTEAATGEAFGADYVTQIVRITGAGLFFPALLFPSILG